MTAQCLWASQKGQDVFAQRRSPHICTLVKGKQGDKHFSLPSSISAPAYRSYIPAQQACHPGYPSLCFEDHLFTSAMTLKRLDPTAVCFALWHIPTPVANIVSCQGFTDLKMLAMADSLAGDWKRGETILLNSPSCQLSIKDETVENL